MNQQFYSSSKNNNSKNILLLLDFIDFFDDFYRNLIAESKKLSYPKGGSYL